MFFRYQWNQCKRSCRKLFFVNSVYTLLAAILFLAGAITISQDFDGRIVYLRDARVLVFLLQIVRSCWRPVTELKQGQTHHTYVHIHQLLLSKNTRWRIQVQCMYTVVLCILGFLLSFLVPCSAVPVAVDNNTDEVPWSMPNQQLFVVRRYGRFF